jgi:ketosteroid isomerase-like protein
MKSSFSLLLLTSLVAACQPAPPPVDLEAAKKSLMDADKAWSETTKNTETFVSFFADDASIFPPNAPIQTGREAINAFVTQLMSLPGFSLEWTAKTAEVASSGDLGYTTGSAIFKMNDPAGNPVADTVKYVTVWRKGPDGSWKAVADIFNSDNPASPPGAAAPATTP